MTDHVIVEAEGDWTEETARRIFDTARVAADENGVLRILLDMREVGRPDRPFTRYLSGKYMAEVMGRRYRVAALGQPDNITHYGETVARNRGGDMMAFSDEEAAMVWLLR
jgi:hypothetical protein